MYSMQLILWYYNHLQWQYLKMLISIYRFTVSIYDEIDFSPLLFKIYPVPYIDTSRSNYASPWLSHKPSRVRSWEGRKSWSMGTFSLWKCEWKRRAVCCLHLGQWTPACHCTIQASLWSSEVCSSRWGCWCIGCRALCMYCPCRKCTTCHSLRSPSSDQSLPSHLHTNMHCLQPPLPSSEFLSESP